MLLIKCPATPRRRKNLTLLADYLESLPENYSHFAMSDYFDHSGECSLVRELGADTADKLKGHFTEWESHTLAEKTLFAHSIDKFLGNCGTVACAIGHGPAAGIPLAKSHLQTMTLNGITLVKHVDFDAYSKLFVSAAHAHDWEFLFSGFWGGVDNHHWGAAARIRFLLEHEGVPAVNGYGRAELLPMPMEFAQKLYEPYRVDRRAPATA